MGDFVLVKRGRVFVNHDPLKRCYNGAYFDASYMWGPWEKWEEGSLEEMQRKKSFWEGLNKIATDGRGESAKQEYVIKEVKNA